MATLVATKGERWQRKGKVALRAKAIATQVAKLWQNDRELPRKIDKSIVLQNDRELPKKIEGNA